MSGERRIAIYTASLHGGGAERIMLLLSRGFSERGIIVDLVLANAVGEYVDQVPDSVNIVDLKSRRVLSSLPGLVRYLKKNRPVALLSALDHANIIALWAKRIARVPTRITVSVRNTLSISAMNSNAVLGRLMPYAVRMFYPWADGIVAISRGVAQDLVRVAKLKNEAVHTIYNPVVTPEFARLSEAAIDYPWLFSGDQPVVLGVGRLVPQKNFPLLIRAIAKVKAGRPVRLIILGEGAERASLERLIRDLELQSDVLLPGFVENPFPYMRQASLFALSSNWEGFGNVLVEAMACGTPVVSTDCQSGPAEILGDGEFGRLVPVGDVDAMAKAILDILQLPPDTTALKSRAEEFSLDRIPDQYLDVLYGKQ